MSASIGWVALGSALGGVSRYALALWMTRQFGAAMPWGTLAANVAGCFAIGLLASLVKSPAARMFLMTGFCGGFTTFSSFGLETRNLWQSGETGRAGLYVAASVAACLIAVWLGEAAGRSAQSR